MNEIIKVNYNNNNPTVSARDLHKSLSIKYDFKRWVDSNFKDFTENIDFFGGHMDVRGNQYGGTQSIEDYKLTIDMAKHLCLMSKTKKGKQCRQYLIDLEKAWNTPEQVMARALKIAEIQINQLSEINTKLEFENTQQKQLIGELKPKADYTDKILQSKDLVTITQIAKDYGMSGMEMNKKLHTLKIQYKQNEQWLLYSNYQAKGYTHSETIRFYHEDGTPDTKMVTKWTQKGRLFLYDKLKENGILPVIEKDIVA